MDLAAVLQLKVQEFISQNLNQDVNLLSFKKNPFPEINWLVIINQIIAKKKSQIKLPTWFNVDNVVFPDSISVEQTSSEIAAKHKSNLISGQVLVDLTGGFGVDSFYFSKKFEKVIHCEINSELSQIVQHNFKLLKANNIACEIGDGFEILQTVPYKIDWIYVDPSRRSGLKGKVFMLQDCLPNVPNLLPDYFVYTNKILVKTAPILDITAGLLELKNVKNIHIVAINNEVKELLWEIWKDYDNSITIKTCNYIKDAIQTFNFDTDADIEECDYSLPKKYLYEPNAAILKSGAFNAVAIQFNIAKLHQHSHLYTSDKLIEFPGRVFIINHYFEFSNSTMKKQLQNSKSNITIRNFPLTVENIRKKWKILDGGNQYSFFTTDLNNNKIVLICEKI